MKPASVLLLPKICHLHGAPMEYVEDRDHLSSGWRCSRCVIKCPRHGGRMQSGGRYNPIMYCRRCRIARIRHNSQSRREPTPLNVEGVAMIIGRPTP